MGVARITCLGIDLNGGGRKPVTFVALDSERRLMALGAGQEEDALAFAAGQTTALVAINAPLRPNCGLMAQPEVRRRLTPPPPARLTRLRVAEYELEQYDIAILHTPTDAKACPSWMRRGFWLSEQLSANGYQTYPATDASARCYLETNCAAAYHAWLGLAPYAETSLEGRLQRQLTLLDHGLPVPDPMNFFEEITRYRLLHSALPLQDVYSPGELNAWAAAATAWLAFFHPEELFHLGDVKEGLIFLPARPSRPRPAQMPLQPEFQLMAES